MRPLLRVLPGVLCLLLPACAPEPSGELPSVKIEKVRVGLPAGAESTRIRPGTWCPVYVTLKAGAKPIARDAARLVVRSTDGDEIPFRYTAAIPALNAEETQTILTYTRPGTAGSEIAVEVTTNDGRVATALPAVPGNPQRDVLEQKEPLVVMLGSRTVRPDPPGKKQANDEEQKQVEEEFADKNLAYLESVEQMPDQWFGYDAADAVVLATGKKSFMDDLTENPRYTDRREALREWVRRGGRLVLSVGQNHQAAAVLLNKTGLIECRLRAPITRQSLPNLTAYSSPAGDKGVKILQGLEVADVEPKGSTSVLLTETGKDRKPFPVILQGACGQGRVILLAFDPENNPFAGWSGRDGFWTRLQRDLGVRSSAVNKDAKPEAPTTEIVNEIQRNLETFDDVPVISFGWVALFILFYIGLVGPLDYFILKKVFKRLELTWITFPATVLLVSAMAYFTAYLVKGDDLHINKLDLVDIDLNDNSACGTSWFTLFSPRIENYTLGIEPAAPAWVAAPSEESKRLVRSWTAKGTAAARPIHSTTVAVFAPPDQGQHADSSTLYPQPYDYTEAATGVERVPIPVWATRSFTASWSASLPPQRPIEAALHLPRGGEPFPLGEITNNLPVALNDAALFYRGEWCKLGTLEPGETRMVSDAFARGKAPLEQWLSDSEVLKPKPAEIDPGRRRRFDDPFNPPSILPRELRAPYQLVKQAWFFARSEQAGWQNSGLRRLDQSWRITTQRDRDGSEHFRPEVMLVARAGPQRGKVEDLTARGFVPTALWLNHLPGTVPERPKVAGFLTQETYIRVFIPVARGQ